MPSEAMIYRRQESIPDFLQNIVSTTIDGKFLIDLPSLKEREFDGFWTDGISRLALQELVPIEERDSYLENVGFTDRKSRNRAVGGSMRKITEINREKTPSDIDARFEYQQALYEVFSLLGARLKVTFETDLFLDNVVFFPPLRGADLIRSFFQSDGIIKNPKNVVNYELKRDYLPDGKPVVGIIDEGGYPERDFETGIFLDDCLASDVSASASIDLMRQKYPGLKNIAVVVSAATLRGVNALAKQNPDVMIEAAVPVFSMTDHFYLLRTAKEHTSDGVSYGDNTFFVGDMGAWAEKLPDAFNKEAPWNRFRT